MLTGKNIVITGAASGIGAETAKLAQQMGGYVIGIDRNPITDNVDRSIKADLMEPDSIDAAIAQIDVGIDALCNVAGVPPTLPRDVVLKVNLLALQRLTTGLVEKMNDGGSIVNVASLCGIGWADSTEAIKSFLKDATFDNLQMLSDQHDIDGPRSYFFSKEALRVWTMLNRWTWRDRGIRMNCVSPGPVETPILKDFIETLGERAEEDMRIMDRPGTPADVAPVIAFLCSDASAWIRGANIPCDGGMSSHILCQMNQLES
jgi:NAD(P)-dependent dehydrogenase (short-subunit alcohol dehydrogenase family)